MLLTGSPSFSFIISCNAFAPLGSQILGSFGNGQCGGLAYDSRTMSSKHERFRSNTAVSWASVNGCPAHERNPHSTVDTTTTSVGPKELVVMVSTYPFVDLSESALDSPGCRPHRLISTVCPTCPEQFAFYTTNWHQRPSASTCNPPASSGSVRHSWYTWSWSPAHRSGFSGCRRRRRHRRPARLCPEVLTYTALLTLGESSSFPDCTLSSRIAYARPIPRPILR
jgi:hypothetical protein